MKRDDAIVEPLRAQLAAQGVRYVFAQFTDIHGAAKGKTIPLDHLGDLFAAGAGFAGPSIWGTGLPRHGARSEYYGRGDASTALPLPWLPGHARVVLDGYVDGKPFPLCPRQLLRAQVARLAERGLTLNAGLEPEFFLLRRKPDGSFAPADSDDRLDKPSYDYKSLTRQQAFVVELTDSLKKCGLDVFQIDHEDAAGQYELNYHYSDALTAADRHMLFKMAAHSIAESLGFVFSMMPKPFADTPGSGLHFHLSLAEQGGRNVFADAGRYARPVGDRHGVSRRPAASCAGTDRAVRTDRQFLQAPGGRRIALGHHLGAGACELGRQQPDHAGARGGGSSRMAPARQFGQPLRRARRGDCGRTGRHRPQARSRRHRSTKICTNSRRTNSRDAARRCCRRISAKRLLRSMPMRNSPVLLGGNSSPSSRA